MIVMLPHAFQVLVVWFNTVHCSGEDISKCGCREEEGVSVWYLLLPQSFLHSTCFTHFSPYIDSINIWLKANGITLLTRFSDYEDCSQELCPKVKDVSLTTLWNLIFSTNPVIGEAGSADRGSLFGQNEEVPRSEDVIKDIDKVVRSSAALLRQTNSFILKISWPRCIRGILPWVHWVSFLLSTALNVLKLF